eukprot:6295-Heterococcus_DN1.PRE.1
MPFGNSSSSSTTNLVSSAAVEVSPPAPSLLQRSAAAAAAVNTASGSSGATPTGRVAAQRYTDEAALTSRDRGMRSASSSPRSSTARGVARSLSNSSGPHRHDAGDAPLEKASASELAVYDQLSSVSQPSVSSTVLTDMSARLDKIETMLGELLAAGAAEQAAPSPAPLERSSSRRGILRQRSAEGAAISSSNRNSSSKSSVVISANASALTATAREIAAAKEHLAVLKAQEALQRRSYGVSDSHSTAQQAAAQATLSQSERGSSSSSKSKLQKFATLFSTKRTTSSSSSYHGEGLVDSQPRSPSNRAAVTAGTAAADTAAIADSTAAAAAVAATAESSNSTEHRRGRLSTIAEDRSRSLGRSSDFEFAAALAQDEALQEQLLEGASEDGNSSSGSHDADQFEEATEEETALKSSFCGGVAYE